MRATVKSGTTRLDRCTILTILGPALAYPIAGIDPLVFNLNLASVANGVAVPPGSVGLLAGAATLVVAATVLAVGNLGDRLGLKRVLLVGLGANVAVSLASACVPDYPVLLILRFLDGLTLATILGVALALVSASVRSEVRARSLGFVMAIYTLMYGATPVLGGWLVTTFGWRSLFLVTVPFATVAIVLTARFVREPARGTVGRFDVLGVVLFGITLLGLVVGLGAVPNGMTEPATWVPLAVCALALLALLRHSRTIPNPALNTKLFARRGFLIAILATVAINIFAAALGTIVGQLGSYVLTLSAQTIGLLYLPGTLLVALASVIAGRMVAAHTAQPVIITGLVIVSASGMVLAATASPVMATAVLVAAIWLDNLGGFITSTAAADAILSRATPGSTGSVAAVQPAFSMAGYALGPTLVILLLEVFYRRAWMADAAALGLSPAQAQQDVAAVTHAVTSSPGPTGFSPALAQLAQGLSLGVDYTSGIRITMAMVALIPLLVVLTALIWRPHEEAGSPRL